MKLKKETAALHEKISNIRKDAVHKMTKQSSATAKRMR